MLNSIIESSLNNRFFVLMATALVAGLGVYSAGHLPIDAVPDLTNVQVQVITEAPALTALGEVFQFQVKATPESGISPMDLRTLLDWFIAYQLRRVEGVTEINPHGGEMKTYEVQADPDKLASYRLSMTHLFDALRSNNA